MATSADCVDDVFRCRRRHAWSFDDAYGTASANDADRPGAEGYRPAEVRSAGDRLIWHSWERRPESQVNGACEVAGDLSAIQELLGHRDLGSTHAYTRWSRRDAWLPSTSPPTGRRTAERHRRPIHHTPDHPDSFGITYTGEETEPTRQLSRLVGQGTCRVQMRLPL